MDMDKYMYVCIYNIYIHIHIYLCIGLTRDRHGCVCACVCERAARPPTRCASCPRREPKLMRCLLPQGPPPPASAA